MGSLAGDMETSCDPPPYLVQPTFSNRRFSYMITQSVTLSHMGVFPGDYRGVSPIDGVTYRPWCTLSAHMSLH